MDKAFIKNPVEAYEKLKEENKKLKEEKQGLIKDWEEKKNLGYEIACKNEKLKAENEELRKINKANAKSYEKFWYKLENYKQALKEIKEIAEKEIACDDCNFQGTGECASSCPSFYLDDFCKSLLQKISEVIDDKAN